MGSKKWNWIFRLQAWMDSKTGQQFLNYAYSWGASIVILGALFKLTHIAGANMMLFIGMGTEVLVLSINMPTRATSLMLKTRDSLWLPRQLMTVKKQKREVRLSLVAVALVVEPSSSVETVVLLLAVARLSLVAADQSMQARLLQVARLKLLLQQAVKRLWMQQPWLKVFLISPYLSITV